MQIECSIFEKVTIETLLMSFWNLCCGDSLTKSTTRESLFKAGDATFHRLEMSDTAVVTSVFGVFLKVLLPCVM